MLCDSVDGMYSQNQQRVMSRCHHSSSTYSSQSVLTAVQHFVSAVNTMNETIMVPSRLLDMDISINKNKPLPELLQNEKDPYAIYRVINDTKNDLLYGIALADDEDEPIKTRARHDTFSDRWSSPSEFNSNNTTNTITNSSNHTTPKQQTPTRRESTLSMISVTSNSSESSTESDIAEESQDGSSDGADSALGVDDATTTITPTPAHSVTEASSHLRSHLIGLYSCLTQLSDTATFIADIYQEDICK